MITSLKIEAEISIPMMLHGLCAGFPSPADDFIEDAVDLAISSKTLQRRFYGVSTGIQCATLAFSTATY